MSYPQFDAATLAYIVQMGLANGSDYDASTNPHGYGHGGHRINFTNDLNATAAVANALADLATYANTQATNAASSATSASNAAANLSGTSTTSVALGTGSKSFTTQSGKDFGAGRILLITSDANPTTNWMVIQVTSYSSTTLQGTVLAFAGSEIGRASCRDRVSSPV